MSLSSALNAARAGLTYTSRWAHTTSNNIANANTPGYARRSLLLTTSGLGEPMVRGIAQAVDSSLDRMYRLETARGTRQDVMASGLNLYTTVLGQPESSDSVLSRLTDFRSALGLLSVSPADTALQRAAVSDATELATSLNRAHVGLDQTRRDAETGVANDVVNINETLQRIAQLNQRLGQEHEETDLRLSLADQMNQELDNLGPLMDFTLRFDTFGRAEIFASGGTPLVTGIDAETLEYDRTTGVLTANGADITPGQVGARGITEGSLAGNLELLHTVVPQMQHQLDETARALIEEFQLADTSRSIGDSGLFTDAGAALDGPYTPGLAGRIAVNDAVRPEMGGALWRMRDGMSAAIEGQAGDSTQINAFIATLDGRMDFDPAAGLGTSTTLSQYVSTLIANQQQVRVESEVARDSYSISAQTVEASRQGFMGVNIDDEMQQLLAIEQAYGANAQVMSTVAEMVDTLLNTF